MKSMLRSLSRGNLLRILVGDPPSVDGIHMDAVTDIIGGRGARHHVECRLRHVRVRMPNRLVRAIKLPLDGGDIHDMLVALRSPRHQWLEPRVDDERGDCIDEMNLEQLHRRYFGQEKPPGVAPSKIQLLKVLIE